MRRRRKSQGVWFPVLGSNLGYEEGSDAPIWGATYNLDINTANLGNPMGTAQVLPVTYDTPREDPAAADSSLADVVGSEYFLKRIVGKLVINSAASSYCLVKVAAGFFISRASADGGFPVGWQNQYIEVPPSGPDEIQAWNNFSPLANTTIREPWIWRRTWLLEPIIEPQAQPINYMLLNPRALPASNAFYGSIQDGPHVDAKTKRRVTSDDRLWFAWATTFFPYMDAPATSNDVTASLVADLDIRIFASLRKARNRGVF